MDSSKDIVPRRRARVVMSKNKSKFTQGLYIPKNPEKYIGNINKIRFMSAWELETHQFLDNNPNVVRWSSETIAIEYIKPTDGKLHKYYPDYYVEYKNQHGELIREIIEVKPKAQTSAPRGGRKVSLYEATTWAVNKAKWNAAARFCAKHGILFRIVTEKKIYR